MYYCTMPVPDWGRLGARAPTPHEEAAVSVLKKNSRINMYINGLVVFGVFWGGLGVFQGRRFQKKKFSALYVWWWFGGVWCVLGWFGVFWVGLGISRPYVSKKRNLAHYM